MSESCGGCRGASDDVLQARLSLRLGDVCAGGDFGLNGLDRLHNDRLSSEGDNSFSRIGGFANVFCALWARSASLRPSERGAVRRDFGIAVSGSFVRIGRFAWETGFLRAGGRLPDSGKLPALSLTLLMGGVLFGEFFSAFADASQYFVSVVGGGVVRFQPDGRRP